MTERATLRTIDGKPVLRLERRLRHAPGTVWRAVSEPAELKHWFPAAVEMRPRPGAPMRFTFPEQAPVTGTWDGEVLEIDPPRVFMFRWNTDVLRIELIPDGDGCRLVFTQTIGGGEAGRLGAGRTAAGWDACLDTLAGRLDGVAVPARTDWLTPMADYIEEFGLGFGTARATDDGWELRFARDVVWQPPADVWALLVEDSPLDDAPPARATNDYVPAGRLTRADPPHALEYEWRHDGAPAGRVRWAIVSDPGVGVLVEVTQTVPAALADVRATAMAAWHVQLELLFAAVQGETGRPWPRDRTEQLAKHYAEQL